MGREKIIFLPFFILKLFVLTTDYTDFHRWLRIDFKH